MSKFSQRARWVATAGLCLTGLVAISGIAQASPGDVSTLAGSGVTGSVNGTGTAASFNSPFGIATDPSGNVYVSDIDNRLIRKITPGGLVSTFAGSGAVGSTDGLGTAASFNVPEGLGSDTAGNIYVADSVGQSIRVITPGGLVSTLAGFAGANGSVNGPVATATFDFPSGVAADAFGNVYVADSSNNLIRKISGGIVSTLAGSGAATSIDGTGTAASFKYPTGIVTDTAGNVFVSDYVGSVIRKITPGGVVTTFAGTAGVAGNADGTGAAASFQFPSGLSIDGSNNLYVADRSNFLIRKITPGAVVSTIAGLSFTVGNVDGSNSVATFGEPISVALSGGNLYVADYGNFSVRRIDITGIIPVPGATSSTSSSTSTSTTSTSTTSSTTTPTSTTTSISPTNVTTSSTPTSSTSSTSSTTTSSATSTTVGSTSPSTTTTSTTTTSAPGQPTTTTTLTGLSNLTSTTTTKPSPTPIVLLPNSGSTLTLPQTPSSSPSAPSPSGTTSTIPTTRTVASLIATSSIPPSVAPSAILPDAVTTPAYTGSSNLALLLTAGFLLTVGASLLCSARNSTPKKSAVAITP